MTEPTYVVTLSQLRQLERLMWREIVGFDKFTGEARNTFWKGLLRDNWEAAPAP